LYKNVIISFIISFLAFSCAGFSQNSPGYGGTSITDFTIHKVVPKKTPPSKIPAFNPDTESIESKKTEAKTSQKPAVNKKNTFAPSKPKPDTVKQKTATKGYSKPKAEMPDKATAIKQPPKTQPAQPNKIAKETETTASKNTELSQERDSKKNKKIEFNKDNYAKKLNSYLDNDELNADPIVKAEESGWGNYDYIVKPSISLAIVLLLMFILAWLYSKARGMSPNSSFFEKFGDSGINKFKILATSVLGQGKVIQLVEINGKQLVIGSTNNNVNLLTEITPKEMENLRAQAEEGRDFRKKEKKAPPKEEDEYFDPESYSARYSDLYREYTDKNGD